MKIGYIYTLSDPQTEEIRYVGQTVNVEKRYALHLFHSKNGRARTHKEKWINSLMAEGKKPLIEIIWKGDYSLIDEREIYFISLFKLFEQRLTNSTNGGKTTSGRPCSEETKKKLSEKHKGVYLRPPISDAEKLAASIRMKGFKHTDKSKKLLSEARKGKPSFWTYNEMPQDDKERIANIGRESSKQIIAIKNNTETIFPSLVEAEKQTGCDRKSMRMVANGVYNQCKGYKFKFVQA